MERCKMGKIKYIRPLIDGGCSECSASEENVGKRRCRHVLETANITVVEKSDNMSWIDIDGRIEGEDSTFSIKASTKEIQDYIKELSTTLTTKEKKEILDYLQNE